MPFLKLIRFPNLFMIALTQFIMYRFIIVPFAINHGIDLSFDTANLSLLALSTILLAAGGYIINDYFDIRIDRINHPFSVIVDKIITRRIAILIHFVLTAAAIAIGIAVAYYTGKYWLSLLHLSCAILLWFYSTDFKYRLLIGNMAIGFLTALVPFIVLLYSCNINFHDGIDNTRPALLISGFALFAFLTTIAREINKDMEDYRGDLAYHCNTIPVKYGIGASKIAVISVVIFTVFLLVASQYLLISSEKYLHASYLLLGVEIPYLYYIYRIYRAQNPPEFHFCSSLNKFIMLAGVIFGMFPI